MELGAAARHGDPIALLEIDDAVGEGRERQRVRAEIHLALAVADRERRALARADQQVVLAVEEIDQREGAAQALQRRGDRLRRALARRHFVFDQKGRDLRIGLGGEAMALGDQLLAQGLEVLDDAVVDDGETGAGVRMGVGFRRLAVRRPARVADADRALERRCLQARLEVLQLALGAQPRQPAAFERGDARRIVAAVFEPLQGGQDVPRHRPSAENAYDPAHRPVRFWRPELGRLARVRPSPRRRSSHVG